MTTLETMLFVDEKTGARLEIVGGLPVWEASPGFQHQSERFRIQSSIEPETLLAPKRECECVHAGDVYIRFPEGSLKQTDIAVFCRTPTEMKEAITMLPEAVVEILSDGCEDKDLAAGVPFYLRTGIKDILVFDATTGLARHFRPRRSEAQYQSPQVVALACGCQITV